MHGSIRALLIWGILAWAGIVCIEPAIADLADVYLNRGTILRGDVTVTETEVVVRNVLGEVRFSADEVVRVVPVGPAATQPMTQPAPPEAPEADAEFEDELPAPPLLSPLDIQRLKFQELRLDGPAEQVRVKYPVRQDRQRLAEDVLTQAAAREDFDASWREILLRGRPEEQLQLIIALTGTKHADRIEISGDPEIFSTFRQRVLPLVTRGCARSGCHGGPKSQVFRLPTGSQRKEAVAYTAFAMLESMQTQFGPLVNRDDPEASVLLSFMLPSKGNPRPHPDISGKRRVTPVLRNQRLPLYDVLVEWIDALRTPHDDYGLDYAFPAVPAAEPAPAEPDTPEP